ncbi:MAG: hypothetical protein LC641_12950 [Spirochaeta sp.]|nr:hypothetical protein [Spirochaeta sp.]
MAGLSAACELSSIGTPIHTLCADHHH